MSVNKSHQQVAALIGGLSSAGLSDHGVGNSSAGRFIVRKTSFERHFLSCHSFLNVGQLMQCLFKIVTHKVAPNLEYAALLNGSYWAGIV